MSRFGGRFVPNIEHEVRRLATEPVVKWRQEWVVPTGTLADGSSSSAASANVGVKILKWVRVPDETITFPEEQDVQAEDRVSDDAAIVEAPVQSIHNAPAVSTPASGSIVSAGGGLGSIAPKEPAPAPEQAQAVAPASAIPPHLAQTFSEPTSGVNTTGENTPDDSVANTPAPAADESVPVTQAPSSQGEPATASGTGANTPQIQPQVEAQLHEQPTTGPTPDTQTLAVLAAGAEAEQQTEGAGTTTEAETVPITVGPDTTTVGGDIEMKDA